MGVRVVGRRLKPIEERTSNLVTFRHNETPEFYQALQKAYILIKREKKNLGHVFSEALIEYTHRHYDLAFQTNLQSYSTESPLNQGQVEQEIIQYFIKRQENHYEVNARDIGEQVRLNGVKGEQTSPTIDRIVKQLLAKEVRVIQ